MYGKNVSRAQDKGDTGESLHVIEIFKSIQGEGIYAGRPAIFIRLAYCCNKCYFCDTEFEKNAQLKSINEIFSEIVQAAQPEEIIPLIVITGGEPFVQNFIPLVSLLYSHKYEVQIETSGALFFNKRWNWKNKEWLIPHTKFSAVDKKVTFVCSPKTGKIADGLGAYIDCWKYVINSKNYDSTTGLVNYSTQKKDHLTNISLPTNTAPIYLQPMDEGDQELNKRNAKTAVELALKFDYRISLQLHKILDIQ